jgi:FKBP-type peptidyl-prolyl cis-trans isomerase
MKKLLYLLITFTVLALPFVSCGNDDNQIDEAWVAVNEQAYKDSTKAGNGYVELLTDNGGPSGVFYRVNESGTGTEYPLQTSNVKVLYAGYYYDGTVFDAGTTVTGAPTEFAISGTVRGFSFALQNMVVGDDWDICIPYYLGYGAAGKTDYYGSVTFKGYTTLYFRNVKLVSITRYP